MKNYFNKTKIIFGVGKRNKINEELTGENILILSTKRGKIFLQKDKKITLDNKKKFIWIDNIKSNPSKILIKQIIKKIYKLKIHTILAYGGGSVIDVAKYIKYFLKKNGYKTKLVAVPTISGTGSEVTQYATIWDKKNKKKISISEKYLLPNTAIVDPQLTVTAPIEQVINSGLDCLVQAFDSCVWNKKYNIKIYKLGCACIKNTIFALRNIKNKKKLIKSRNMLAKASLYSGWCIGTNKTSICHSMSYPLTSYLNMPHGLACGVTMIQVIKYLKSKNKNFFNKFLKISKYNSYDKFLKDINELFYSLKIKHKSKVYFLNEKKINKTLKYMYTKNRADNFIYRLDLRIIKKIFNQTKIWVRD